MPLKNKASQSDYGKDRRLLVKKRSVMIALVACFLVAAALTVYMVVQIFLARHPIESNAASAGIAGREQNLGEYTDVIKAMASLSWLQYEYSQFQQNAAKYDEAFQTILSRYRANKPVEIQKMISYQNALTNFAKSFGQAIELDRHPLFDQHPEQAVAGEETIERAADKVAYRKYASQYATASLTISELKRWYEDQIRRSSWIVRDFLNKH